MASTQTLTQEAPPSFLSVATESERSYATVDELIKHRAEELKSFPLISYPRNGLLDFENHSGQALDRYIDAAVVKLRSLGLEPVVCEVHDLTTRNHNL